MKKRTAIIIEDEIRAQIYLNGIIAQELPHVQVLAVCDDLPSGVIAIRKYKPDVVFLDIEMPKYNGLEIVNFFDPDEMNFAIIFTTAYNEYAIKAFKTSAVDYLLKPIDADELKESMQRLEFREHMAQSIVHAQQLMTNTAKIGVPDGNSIMFLNPDDILYFKADNSYTHIFSISGKKMTTSRGLKKFEEQLEGYSNFFRCHKSYVVNLNHIVKYNKSNGGTLQLIKEIELPVSVDKVDELLQKFNQITR